VANYIVDITVALKGSEKITRFNKQLQTTSKQIQAVNDLVKVQEALVGGLVKSFDNLSSNLAKAKSNFNAVASGTRLQEKAARQLIKAEKELNGELQQRDRLLSRLRGTGKMNLPGTGVGSDPVAKSIARRRRKLIYENISSTSKDRLEGLFNQVKGRLNSFFYSEDGFASNGADSDNNFEVRFVKDVLPISETAFNVFTVEIEIEEQI